MRNPERKLSGKGTPEYRSQRTTMRMYVNMPVRHRASFNVCQDLLKPNWIGKVTLFENVQDVEQTLKEFVER